MIKRSLGVLLAGTAAVLLLYFVPERKPPKRTRYHDMVDSAYTVLPAAQVDSLKLLEKAHGKLQGEAQAEALLRAAARWEKVGFDAVAAERYRLAAEAEPGLRERWAEAGDRFFSLVPGATQDDERVDYVFHAIYCYEKLLKIDFTDYERKIRLADCYTDYQGNVMQGVVLLRQVAAADPDNANAQLRLGRFALMSGQTDKAIERFRAVLSKDSLNLPARVVLAQTLANSQDLAGAKQVLKEGIALHPDSASRQELEGLLLQLGPDPGK
ncbi:MAG: tetratricopeptide repeat protein [Bacteroidetes bacterium]|nr:tetratricopeptide repeat protein [Bacteroidota bacterium]